MDVLATDNARVSTRKIGLQAEKSNEGIFWDHHNRFFTSSKNKNKKKKQS